MKNIKKSLMGILIASIMLVTISNVSLAADPIVKIDASNNGGTIYLLEGSTLNLTLRTNPTTGYTWDFTKLDQSMLMLISEEHWGFNLAPHVNGAGHMETWIFKAVHVGITTLQLKYYRPWDPKDIAGTYKITIVILQKNLNLDKTGLKTINGMVLA